MMFDTPSPKQAAIFRFPHEDYDALICDGAVRSGKTMMMIYAFIFWSMKRFDGAVFGICGKTVQSAERNILQPLLETKSMTDAYAITYTRSTKLLTVRRGGAANFYYIFGGKDESSYMLIQGLTLSGIFFDEVALMPRSFVEQGITRTLSVDNAKLWFNCNPESPAHWFYNEWILKAEEHNAKHLHFVMEDNPGLSKRAIERAKRDFQGAFYDRYVLGEWVKADGLIFPAFTGEKHTFGDDKAPKSGEWFISIDYGIQNPFAALLWCVNGNRAYCMAEYYHDGRKKGQRTDEEHADAVVRLAGGRFIKTHIIDPSALSFITCLERRGLRVTRARNEVLPGIANTATALLQGRLMFHKSCVDTIREFSLYVWDAKAKDDRPAKENDHAMDAVRYFVRTALRRILSVLNRRATGADENESEVKRWTSRPL